MVCSENVGDVHLHEGFSVEVIPFPFACVEHERMYSYLQFVIFFNSVRFPSLNILMMRSFLASLALRYLMST